jgi:hypothetical protein
MLLFNDNDEKITLNAFATMIKNVIRQRHSAHSGGNGISSFAYAFNSNTKNTQKLTARSGMHTSESDTV